MSAEQPIHATSDRAFKPTPLAIFLAAAIIVLFVVAAIAPAFNWMSVTPTGERAKPGDGIFLTGFGTLSAKFGEEKREGSASGSGAPQGMLVAVVAGVFVAVSVASLVFLFLGLPRKTTQTALRYTTFAAMVGAIMILIWNILWVWKINSFGRYAGDKEILDGASIAPSLGIFVGVGACVLAAFCLMALSSAVIESANFWMRIAEVGGLVLSCTLLLVVAPWDGESLGKSMESAMSKEQKVRER